MNPEPALNTDANPPPRLSERLAVWENLLAHKDGLERRRAEAQAVLNECDAQLVGVQQAREMLARVERALESVQPFVWHDSSPALATVEQAAPAEDASPPAEDPVPQTEDMWNVHSSSEDAPPAEDPVSPAKQPVSEDLGAPIAPIEDAVPEDPPAPPAEPTEPEPEPEAPAAPPVEKGESPEPPVRQSGSPEADRQAVLGVLREKRRMMSESMILNQLRPWKMPRLRLVLSALETDNLVKSTDGGQRWGIV